MAKRKVKTAIRWFFQEKWNGCGYRFFQAETALPNREAHETKKKAMRAALNHMQEKIDDFYNESEDYKHEAEELEGKKSNLLKRYYREK